MPLAYPEADALSVAELMTAWGEGWATSRRTGRPVAFPGGYRIEIGQVGARFRHVLFDYTAGELSGLAKRQAVPGSWLKAAGDPAEFRAALDGPWRMDTAGYLMTTTFRPVGHACPDPYRLETATEDSVTVAVVRDGEGHVAASGRLAHAGHFGIVDRVVTEPVHRRRGLGRLVIRALEDHAAAAGMRVGVLVATEEGRALYLSLGWRVRSDVPGAFVPEPDA
ncbi:FR47-like protein [Stackebrandtia albiflava]|uniref:FR47-like protein n=1 Tax=Stackebrandtia albiflava TaxID=406432 RepID=A0A562V4J9_9ACTN|nr:GNAT family N-acetyltransferase [Stackebrandtia albiflava]TWJ12800.1 FR47-like protein [Stackebrandtia albiflava]